MSADGYRRGRQVTRDQKPPQVSGAYRPIIPVVWGIGLVMAVASIAVSTTAWFWVVVVTHLSFVGLIFGDIRSLRRQKMEWGLTRHLWVSAAAVVPLVAPVYWWYAGRKIAKENERRGYVDGEYVGIPDHEGDDLPADVDVGDLHDVTDDSSAREVLDGSETMSNDEPERERAAGGDHDS